MNLLYIKGAVIAFILASALGVIAYIKHLQTKIEQQNTELALTTRTIKEQQASIIGMTQDRNEVQAKLEVASKQSVIIKERVVKQLKAAPPAPKDCEPAFNWLRARALELQDKK